ncbi:MAG: helix-turn-helix transcriptional regulator [Leptolyngbya sp. SIO1E4]|nr:helix-turn-helix transcriptional regulator [Leptolyngbya sp. SIO1E4]
MKPGSKYYPLYQHLAHCQQDPIALTLADIETLIAGKLPASAWTKRAWWSNRAKGALQAAAWIAAGYHTDTIDLETQVITFKTFEAEYKVEYSNGEITWNQAAIKALRKHMQLTQAQFAETLGVRRQTVSEWENGVYLPDRSTLKHLGLVAEKEDFQGLPDTDAGTDTRADTRTNPEADTEKEIS